MTIPATEPKKIFVNGNGVATIFSFAPMQIFEASDLEVTRITVLGIEILLTEGTGATQYTINITDFPGTPVTGSITFPSTGDPLPSGEKLVMKAVLPLEQQTDLENQGGYFPDVQETQFDKLLKLLVQQQEQLDRSIRLGVSSQGVNLEFPVPVADRLLGWDATATNIVNKASAGTITTTAFSESLLDDSTPEIFRDTLWQDTGKGDLILSLGGSSQRLPIGINDQVLTADSTKAEGVRWGSLIEAGTKMLFQQTAAPTGWTKDAVHNNKALRVVTGAAASGGSNPFSTVFPQATTGSHILTASQVPGHFHFGYTPNDAGLGGGVIATEQVRSSRTTANPGDYNMGRDTAAATLGRSSSEGGGLGHTHTLTMDLQFVDLIIATKD